MGICRNYLALFRTGLSTRPGAWIWIGCLQYRGPDEMRPIPLNTETKAVARRIIWFEDSAKALADPVRFMAYAMAHATHEDMTILRQYVSDDDFLEALKEAPPGIIDPRSWAYWNAKMGRYPAPPMPKRKFGDG